VCRDQSDLDATEQCIKQLQKLEARGLLWRVGSLQEAMTKLFAVGDVGDDNHVIRVQIMTMHKSKGLEFDTVIMPALHRKPRGDTKQLLSWFRSDANNQFQLLLAPFNEINQDPGPILKLVRSANERCNSQEVIRLLYVACTRAKQRLHLLGTVKHSVRDGSIGAPIKSSLLSTLWPILESEFDHQDPGAPDHVDADHADAAVFVPQLKRLPLGWQAPELNVFDGASQHNNDTDEVPSIEYLWASTAARDIGTVVHAQLQRMAEHPAAQQQLDKLPDIVACQLRSLGMPDNELKASVKKVLKAIDNTLSDKRGQWILDPSHQDAVCEWALTGMTDDGLKSIVIDRSFIDNDGTRWIIDFKTGDHTGSAVDTFLDQEQERYTDQLKGYAEILRMNDERPVRMGLYFPLLKAFRELDGEYDNTKNAQNAMAKKTASKPKPSKAKSVEAAVKTKPESSDGVQTDMFADD